MRLAAPRAVLAAGLLAAWVASACGYSAGLRVKPEGVRALGIEHFGNQTLERDLEREFHDALSRAVRSYVDVPITGTESAQHVLRGTVREYHRRGGIRSPDNVLLETGIYFEAEAGVYSRDPQAAEPVRAVRRASTWVGYVIEPTGRNEREARERAMHHVAEQLVLDLFAGVN